LRCDILSHIAAGMIPLGTGQMAFGIGRREFMACLGGAAAAWPLAARAQQPERMRRIGAMILYSENDPQSRRVVTAFEQGMEKLGWTVGRNLQIDYRFGISEPASAQRATTELLNLAPDLMLAQSPSALRAAQQATHTIPIVFTAVSEPVALGFVASLAHPGGNTSGFTNLEPSVGGKWLELLKEIAPNVTHVAVMANPAVTPAFSLFYRSIEAAAARFAVETTMAPVGEAAEIEAVMTRLGREPGSGLILPPDTFVAFHYKLIAELAARNRLPAIYPFGYYAAAGGLITYGPDIPDEFRRAAAYVDRIFRGERPGDLSVQQPIKFELVINLKTAKALGLHVPQTLLALADEVIE
jgi:putative tryptophan/tyrosine transport system substrate-binding protein